jgi:hypothetical protein
VIVNQKKLISLVGFITFKKKINMVIPVFRGSKGENLKKNLKEYRRACISIGHRTTIKWLNFFPKFLKGTTSHWFER